MHIYNQNIYFLDKGNPCMHIYSLQHNLVRQIISRADYLTSTDCQLLAGWFFCIDWSGNILVPDYHAHCIKIFSERGKLIYILGEEGALDGKFIKPKSIAFSATRAIAVICNKHNGRVQIF